MENTIPLHPNEPSNLMYAIGFISYIVFYVPYLILINSIELIKYLMIITYVFFKNILIFVFTYLCDSFKKTYPIILQNIKQISNDLSLKYNQILNIMSKINNNFVMFKNKYIKFN
jgi:hypothetical protein